MGCSVCKNIDIDIDLVQSVIFKKRSLHKKQILIWNENRARAWLLSRNFVFIEPPDTSTDNQIRFHIEREDMFETLKYQDIGDSIVIVFGVKPLPEPRRQYINFKYKQSSKNMRDNSNIHTLR